MRGDDEPRRLRGQRGGGDDLPLDMAYVAGNTARIGEKAAPGIVVVDDREAPANGRVDGFAFSPDSRRIAWVAYRPDGKTGVVVDGEAHAEHDIAWRPVFSRDGEHLAYVVREGRELPEVSPSRNARPPRRERVMLDGEPGPVFDRVLAGFRAKEDGPAFLDDGSLVYLAVRDDALYRIRHLPR